MANMPLDPTQYIRTPRLTLAGTVTLAETLLAQDPSQDSQLVRSAYEKLQTATASARSALVARQRHLGGDEPTRAVDESADNAWRALFESLAATVRLPQERFPRAKTARRLLSQLFPDGNLDFLRLRYVDQYSMMQAKVNQIEEDGYLPELIGLLGPSFWDEILHTLEEYRLMVQGGLDGIPDDGDIAGQFRLLRIRISDFAYKVAAQADLDDDESVAAAARRLAAIPAAKTLARRGRRGLTEAPSDDIPGDEPSDDTPSDDVPTGEPLLEVEVARVHLSEAKEGTSSE